MKYCPRCLEANYLWSNRKTCPRCGCELRSDRGNSYSQLVQDARKAANKKAALSRSQ